MKSHKPFAIVTASDAHCGDFLADHWLPSIVDHVDLSQTEVVVLDYGLADDHRQPLERRGVHIIPSKKDGFVANLRLRDIVRLLDASPCQRLLLCDAGDIIFQTDVSRIFAGDATDKLAAVKEERHTPFYEVMADYGDVRPEMLTELVSYDVEHPILNIGVVCATAQTFRDIWTEYVRFCADVQCYGSDQLVFNYFAYHRGFRALDVGYNFVPLTTRRRFRVRNGVFYDGNGRVIPIVHNAGGNSFLRVVDRFGYGPDRNRPRRCRSALLHAVIPLLNIWHALIRRFGRPVWKNAAVV